MTLDEAVRVLNERGHRGDRWRVYHRVDVRGEPRGAGAQQVEGFVDYPEFDAVAVAEKLERDAAPEAKVPSREWLLKAADAEDETRSVSVGGLAADLGMLAAPEARPPAWTKEPPTVPGLYLAKDEGVDQVNVVRITERHVRQGRRPGLWELYAGPIPEPAEPQS